MVRMSEVLHRNDLVYHVLPSRWDFGLPVGNGIVGGMIWVEDRSKVIVTLDHVFAWDLRQHPLDEPHRVSSSDPVPPAAVNSDEQG